MAEASTTVGIPSVHAGRGGTAGHRLARWLASERVFRLIPFLLVEGMFVLIILVPFVLTIWISLLKWRANRPFETARFAGLENYETVLGNDQFWLALGRTFYFAGVAVALELLIGFVLAMLVSRCTRSRQLYTTIFLVPMMIVPIVVGYNFSMIYIDSGPLNQILAPFLERFGIDPRVRWLSHPVAAQWGIIIAKEDDTAVSIRPTTSLAAGTDVSSAAQGAITEYSLKAGEYVQWEPTGEMSGSVVDSNKPVAFVGGSGYLCLQSATALKGAVVNCARGRKPSDRKKSASRR